MPLLEVTDLADPRLADYANLRDIELLQREDPHNPQAHRGLFIAEGELVVRRLIDSRFTTKSVLLTPTRLNTIKDALDHLAPDVPVYLAPEPVINSVVGFSIHRGILAIGLRPAPPRLEDLLARPGPFIILEDLFNHDNIGSIFRNAAALAGPDAAVLMTAKTADPLYRKCVRVSVGNVLSIPFTRLTDWPDPTGADQRALRAANIQQWALTPAPDAIDITEAARTAAPNTRTALLLGSEGPGLSPQALAHADKRITIPMHKAHENVDSLNVAVSAAIALHALNTRRR